jgi:hypothetical protein
MPTPKASRCYIHRQSHRLSMRKCCNSPNRLSVAVFNTYR